MHRKAYQEHAPLFPGLVPEHAEAPDPDHRHEIPVAGIGQNAAQTHKGRPKDPGDLLFLVYDQGQQSQKQAPHNAGIAPEFPHGKAAGQGMGHMGDHGPQQQPLQILFPAVSVIVPLGDEKTHNGRGDHAEAEQGIVPGIVGGDKKDRHMLADHSHHSQQLQCVGVQSGLSGHGDTLFPVEYLCGHLNT